MNDGRSIGASMRSERNFGTVADCCSAVPLVWDPYRTGERQWVKTKNRDRTLRRGARRRWASDQIVGWFSTLTFSAYARG